MRRSAHYEDSSLDALAELYSLIALYDCPCGEGGAGMGTSEAGT